MKKKILVILSLVLAVVLAALVGGRLWVQNNYVVVEGKPYPKNTASLDLRGKDISADTYEQLSRTLPECHITWDVPFQGGKVSSDSQILHISALKERDLEQLKYFPKLAEVDASGCEDYSLLQQLQEAWPAVEVSYGVTVDGVSYPQDAAAVTVSALTEEDLAMLALLPELAELDARECTDYGLLAQFRKDNPQVAVRYNVTLGGQTYSESTQELVLEKPDVAELTEKLPILAELKTVHLVEPEAEAQALRDLQTENPGVEISWQKTVLGKTYTSRDPEIDYSGMDVSIAQIEAAMAYYPGAEKVFLGYCDLDYEELAVYRDRVRPEYKVVWAMMMGKVPVRTDDVFFHPYQHEVYNVFDKDLVNFKYCEDMICVDLGHNSLYHCDWAEGMPNLKYLILAWNIYLEDISGLANCKELVYLELGWTQVRDFTPLLGCTKLEDLHLKYVYSDPGAIRQMTWLKNIFWEACKPIYQEELKKSLPDTYILFGGENSQTKQWRKLDNYFAQRDVLQMPYMN